MKVLFIFVYGSTFIRGRDFGAAVPAAGDKNMKAFQRFYEVGRFFTELSRKPNMISLDIPL